MPYTQVYLMMFAAGFIPQLWYYSKEINPQATIYI